MVLGSLEVREPRERRPSSGFGGTDGDRRYQAATAPMARTPAATDSPACEAGPARRRWHLIVSRIEVTVGDLRTVAVSSISIRASPMSRWRRLGSFSRHRCSSRTMLSGVPAGSAVQSGDLSKIAAVVSATVSPRNTARPVSSSNSTQPNAQMSLRLSTTWPRTCSGLMYGAVPRTMPSSVVRSDWVLVSFTCTTGSLRETEIEDLHVAVVGQLDVRRLQIAVNDSFLVRSFQSVSDLSRDSQSFPDRYGSLRDPIRERRSFHQFEDKSLQAIGFLEPVDRRNVWMIECCQKPRLAREARQSAGILRQRAWQDLDRDIAPELPVAGAIDLPHSSGSEQRENVVAANLPADQRRCGIFTCHLRPRSPAPTRSLARSDPRSPPTLSPHVPGNGRNRVEPKGKLDAESRDESGALRSARPRFDGAAELRWDRFGLRAAPHP